MTKEEVLALLRTVNSANAGTVVAKLKDDDDRFAQPFNGALAAVGYWSGEERRAGVFCGSLQRHAKSSLGL
jgi:hypothetical protein